MLSYPAILITITDDYYTGYITATSTKEMTKGNYRAYFDEKYGLPARAKIPVKNILVEGCVEEDYFGKN